MLQAPKSAAWLLPPTLHAWLRRPAVPGALGRPRSAYVLGTATKLPSLMAAALLGGRACVQGRVQSSSMLVFMFCERALPPAVSLFCPHHQWCCALLMCAQHLKFGLRFLVYSGPFVVRGLTRANAVAA